MIIIKNGFIILLIIAPRNWLILLKIIWSSVDQKILLELYSKDAKFWCISSLIFFAQASNGSHDTVVELCLNFQALVGGWINHV